MKIIKRTSTKLILRETTLPVFMLIWTAGFVGIPLFMAFMLIKDVGSFDFSCQRIEPQQVNCQSTKTPFLWFGSKTEQKYEYVISAQPKTITSHDSEGDLQREHYVIIKSKYKDYNILSGAVYMNGEKGSEKTTHTFSEQLNHFLQSNQQTFGFHKVIGFENNGILFLIIPGIFVFIGIVVFHNTVRRTTLQFDKHRNQLKKQTFSIFGLWSTCVDLDTIKDVIVEEKQDSDGDQWYAIVLMLESGKKIYIESYRTVKSELIECTNLIRDFLDFPLLPAL
jgi:hypothetical protein